MRFSYARAERGGARCCLPHRDAPVARRATTPGKTSPAHERSLCVCVPSHSPNTYGYAASAPNTEYLHVPVHDQRLRERVRRGGRAKEGDAVGRDHVRPATSVSSRRTKGRKKPYGRTGVSDGPPVRRTRSRRVPPAPPRLTNHHRASPRQPPRRLPDDGIASASAAAANNDEYSREARGEGDTAMDSAGTAGFKISVVGPLLENILRRPR